MPLRRLDHVLVLTDDVEATAIFYRDALGFEVGRRPALPFPGVWLCLDGSPCLHVAERTSYVAHAATIGLAVAAPPLDHVAFAADGYDELVARLDAAGVDAVANDVPTSGIRQLFLTDPNGPDRAERRVAERAETPQCSGDPFMRTTRAISSPRRMPA
jgi:catechol 2,3-dioxygenase-like lactoylglutathione lyase family enzyme